MVIYTCSDLFFASRIRSACEDLNAISRPVRNVDMLQKRLLQVDDGKANQPVRLWLLDMAHPQAVDLLKHVR